MFVSSYRVTRFAFQNFWRNFWLSLITISMLVLTLLTINILLILNVVTDRAVSFVEDRIEVSVYLHPTVSNEKAASIQAQLSSLSQVRDVEVVTSEEVVERFRARHQNDAEVLASLDEVGGNPFGPTLVLSAESVSDFDFILKALDNPQFKDDIRETDYTNYQDIIDRIQHTTSRIRLFGLVLASIFFLIAMLIVFNTVRIGIFIHREEIGIMKLVGASNWFVRSPFLLEVILYSFIATLLVAALILPATAVIEPRLGAYFGGGEVGLISYFDRNLWMIFGAEFLTLVLVSMIATGFAMRRYLRV